MYIYAIQVIEYIEFTKNTQILKIAVFAMTQLQMFQKVEYG